jgi:hypothetical protein
LNWLSPDIILAQHRRAEAPLAGLQISEALRLTYETSESLRTLTGSSFAKLVSRQH